MEDLMDYKCVECLRYDPAEDMCEVHYWVNPFENACGLFILDSD